MKLEILEYPDPRLAIVASPVAEITAEVRTLVEDMIETMVHANGIGLAAPQVGISQSIVVIARSVIEACEAHEEAEAYEEECEIEEQELVEPELECLVIINPTLTLLGENIMYPEGCLSVPGYRENVPRKSAVRLEATNEHGELYTIETEGLLAVCIQHELDHLAGKLFIDRISFLKRSLYDKKVAKGLV